MLLLILLISFLIGVLSGMWIEKRMPRWQRWFDKHFPKDS